MTSAIGPWSRGVESGSAYAKGRRTAITKNSNTTSLAYLKNYSDRIASGTSPWPS